MIGRDAVRATAALREPDRLTLDVLLSFAQFEREVTGERIRDKIAASKREGLRVGGPVPLGYQVRDKALVPCPVEAEQVRLIFRRYLELGSLRALLRDLDGHGLLTKARTGRDGTAGSEQARAASLHGRLGWRAEGACASTPPGSPTCSATAATSAR